ncbi:MAG: HD-GYP domain-containing protein [Phycisphaerae bacterium]|nr:HD-GYP domain-containing protein [Phycisphaerae bacterium]
MQVPQKTRTTQEVPPTDGAIASVGSDIVRVASLRVGMRLTKGLFEAATGVLLLAAGTQITPEFLKLLQEREIRYLSTSPEPARTKVVAPRASDEKIIDRLLNEINPADAQLPVRPLTPGQRPRISLAALEQRATRGVKTHDAAGRTLEQFCKTLKQNEIPKNDGLHKIVHEFMDMVSSDLDLMPTILSLQTSADEYLFKHSVNVSALSMNIATQLGMRREKTIEIGLAGLLADVGMLKVPESIRFAPRPLSNEEMAEIRRHPLYTVEYLEKIAGLPREVKYVGVQAHERLDKTGYPRSRGSGGIHAYAKIVAIADVYAAMTCPRPYREAMSPHDAIKRILFDCGAGKYDAVFVRALIDGLSVFPIGSHVELDDGRFARVLRANSGKHTRPVVRILSRDGRDNGEVVDLTTVETRIIRVVRELGTVLAPAEPSSGKSKRVGPSFKFNSK